MNLKFHLKRASEAETSLLTFFKLIGQKVTLYPGQKVQSKNWSQSKQKCLPSHPNFDQINEYLNTWRSTLEKIILKFKTDGQFITKETIQEQLDQAFNSRPVEGQPADFMEFMNEYIASKKRGKRDVQKLEQTRKLVLCAFKLISKENLAAWNSLGSKSKSKQILTPDKGKKVPFAQVNMTFLETFKNFLFEAKTTVVVDGIRTEQNYTANYIDKQVKALKQFIIEACNRGLVTPFNWKLVKTQEFESDNIYCSFEDLEQLAACELIAPIEIMVQDLFLLNANLGMRYSDLSKILPSNFEYRMVGGEKCLIYQGYQKKTKTRVEFVVPPFAVQILEKYNYSLPKVSSNSFNEIIKTVAMKAGFTQKRLVTEFRGHEMVTIEIPRYQLFSSHTMRRSFCTNCFKAGMPAQAIMSISGHTDLDEFMTYVKDRSVSLEKQKQFIFSVPAMQKRTNLKVA